LIDSREEKTCAFKEQRKRAIALGISVNSFLTMELHRSSSPSSVATFSLRLMLDMGWNCTRIDHFIVKETK
jgi:hypothetical protein